MRRFFALAVGLLLAWVSTAEAQGHRGGPSNLAPNPNIRSVAITSANAAGDSANITVSWTPARVRPGDAVADLHILRVFDQAQSRFSVRDSLPPLAFDSIAGLMSTTIAVPTDTVDIQSRACVQASHQDLVSSDRCTDFTVPHHIILEDPGAPIVEITLDSLRIAPDSVAIAVGDSTYLVAFHYSNNSIIGCSGAACSSVISYSGYSNIVKPAAMIEGVPYYVVEDHKRNKFILRRWYKDRYWSNEAMKVAQGG